MSEQGKLRKTKKFLESDENLADIFQFNLFTEDIEFTKKVDWNFKADKGKPLTDMDITLLRDYLSSVHNWEPSKDIIGDACFIIATRKRYHPIKEFIEKEEWDGIVRLDDWLIKATGCDDNAYTRAVSSKFMIATINRIYNPGCKFDHMMILEGGQSIGKSTLCEIMSGDWYLDTNFDNKDLIDSIRNSFWIEISELSGMSKKDVDWLKSFLSRKVDRLRLPYARRPQDFKRKCVFVGTYNPSGNNMYLRDDTGNRRFWPIECKRKIDLDYVKGCCNQLWAEAYFRYKEGVVYHIVEEDALEVLVGIHQERELESPTHIQIKHWLMGRTEADIMDIIHDCLKINTDGKQPRDLLSTATTVGIIMRKLNWKKGTNENRHKYYAPKVEWDE